MLNPRLRENSRWIISNGFLNETTIKNRWYFRKAKNDNTPRRCDLYLQGLCWRFSYSDRWSRARPYFDRTDTKSYRMVISLTLWKQIQTSHKLSSHHAESSLILVSSSSQIDHENTNYFSFGFPSRSIAISAAIMNRCSSDGMGE